MLRVNLTVLALWNQCLGLRDAKRILYFIDRRWLILLDSYNRYYFLAFYWLIVAL
jgi:hypothetical protein